MLELYLIIDESGAKSKSDKQESSLKDFGVMAGFIAPENGYNYMKIAAKRIINELEGTYKKTHLTDLNLEDKSKIIKDFYRFAKINRIPWIYTAIYTQGFFEFHNFEDINKGSQKKESMHSELFKNNIGKAIAFAKDHFPKESMDLKITVISDNISKGIIKDFYNEIENIKAYGENQNTSFNLVRICDINMPHFFCCLIQKIVRLAMIYSIVFYDMSEVSDLCCPGRLHLRLYKH